MNQFVLLSKINVQNANAVSGFTWGFPAITHFLGFTHNLARKASIKQNYSDLKLDGCAVIAHNQETQTYENFDVEFTQTRNPPYLKSHECNVTPPIIEEGRMNMTVSLLIGLEGNLGNRKTEFINWLNSACLTQRLAGGTITNKKIDIEIYSIEEKKNINLIKRRLIPGFILIDRSNYLCKHYKSLKNDELLDAWMDFSAIKKKARPKCNLISKQLKIAAKEQNSTSLLNMWNQHLQKPYSGDIDKAITEYFDKLKDEINKEVYQQWQNYRNPDENTDAVWETIPKPNSGYLVAIMTGYKAISGLYEAGKIDGARDTTTPVVFVEAVHSIGEWKSPHRIEDFTKCLWFYHSMDNWYLCKQKSENEVETSAELAEIDNYDEYNFY